MHGDKMAKDGHTEDISPQPMYILYPTPTLIYPPVPMYAYIM